MLEQVADASDQVSVDRLLGRRGDDQVVILLVPQDLVADGQAEGQGR
jgi:hypothetical protein